MWMFSIFLIVNSLLLIGFLAYTLHSIFGSRVQPNPAELVESGWSHGKQVIGDQSMAFEYRNQGIFVDPQARTVKFVNCHTNQKFWSIRSAPEVTCSLDDIHAVFYHQFEPNGAYETKIVTKHGRAELILTESEDENGELRRIRNYLASICLDKGPVSVSDRPMFPLLLGGLIAVLLIALIMFWT
ncbi:MAG: hypothetical protein EA424_26330 [Planctomycetaceae bacterium]|nr:MAG: hypothetical protein EA424_26330 [Planctomycetaceae bacterium]